MFEDSLLENRGGTKRGWATAASFAVQALLVGFLVLLPLWFTDALPTRELATFLVAPAPPPPPPPPPTQVVRPARPIPVESEITQTGKLLTPTRIPKTVKMIKEQAPPPPIGATSGVVGGVPGGIPGGQSGGVIGGILRATKLSYIPKPAPKHVPKRVRVSQGVTQGLLVRKIQPHYPALAKQARIQGQVRLQAIIAKDGSIENLRLVSGHPLLAGAAIEAVKQWHYKPYLLNGEPVEVETEITVNFSLG